MRRSRRKPKFYKTAINWTGYAVAQAAVRVLQRLPFRAATAVGHVMGTLAYHLGGRERERALSNLAHAFGETYTDAQRQGMVKRMFQNFGMDMAEAFAGLKLTDEQVKKRVINLDDFWNRLGTLRKGRGLICMTGHLGNWEFMGSLGARCHPTRVVANRFHFEPYNRLTEELRGKGGMSTIYLNESPREIVRALKNEELVGILPDQDIRRIPGTYVDFFGRPAWTPIGPVLIAKLSKAPMAAFFMVRQGRRFFVEMSEVIPMTFTGDTVADLRENTQRWSDVYERYIRKHPDQWGWNHHRWNTQPHEVPPAFRRRAGLPEIDPETDGESP